MSPVVSDLALAGKCNRFVNCQHGGCDPGLPSSVTSDNIGRVHTRDSATHPRVTHKETPPRRERVLGPLVTGIAGLV